MIDEIREHLASALLNLPARERRIIESRFHISEEFRTLDELGEELGITRERVRQIETKAKKQLRALCKTEVASALDREPAAVWDLVVGEAHVLHRDDVASTYSSAPAYLRLAFELCDLTVVAWLRRFATPHDHGWIKPGSTFGEGDEARRLTDALAERQLPIPLKSLEGIAPSGQLAPLVRFTGFSIASGYVCKSKPTPRQRRAIGLHRVLMRRGSLNLDSLLADYQITQPDLKCSHRDAELTMSGYPHLFVQLAEGVWAPTLCTSHVQGSLRTNSSDPLRTTLRPPLATTYLNKITRGSIAEGIAGLLEREGPMRISEIQARAAEVLDNGQRRTSIGPVLTTHKHIFRKLLPGLYGLRVEAHFDTSAAAIRRIPQVFREAQVVLYVCARYSGGSLHSFPLWTPTTEALWADWASNHAQPAVFESLLSVVDPDTWPAELKSEHLVRMKSEHNTYRLRVPPRLDKQRIPSLDRLLAAAMLARASSGLGWVTANRVMQRRLTDTSGAVVLALLVGLGVLSDSATDWQLTHVPGPHIDSFIQRLSCDLAAQGNLDWESGLGLDLRERALANRLPHTCWVSTPMIEQLVGTRTSAEQPDALCAKPATTALQSLLDERALVEQRAETERVLRLLSDASALEDEDT